MSLQNLKSVAALFAPFDVEKLLIKILAPSQDNDKNQINFGSSKKGILNLFPGDISLELLNESRSSKKAYSDSGSPKPCLSLDFYWIDPHSGKPHSAPEAKIIDYIQYPEARFSGFLKNCEIAPDCLRRTSQKNYGKRALVLGVNGSGQTFGLTLTSDLDPAFSLIVDLPKSNIAPLFKVFLIGHQGKSEEQLLVSELGSLVGKWHKSQIIRKGHSKPSAFKGPAGAGNTLEAIMNIPANAKKEPDKYGYEIKAFRKGGKISLMTPTADRGEEGRLSFKEFMNTYGWISPKDPQRLVFNGIFKYLSDRNDRFVLDMSGYDSESDKFKDNVSEIIPFLRSKSDGAMVSGWSFEKLLRSWNEKHSKACYVEYESRPYQGNDSNHDKEYRYTGRIYLCEGTNIFRYLRGIVQTSVYYDPAHEIKEQGGSSVRPQWRISVSNKHFKSALEQLYFQVTVHEFDTSLSADGSNVI